MRQLLVVGATAVIRHAKPGSKSASAWLLKLLERRPRKLAAVALANKMARIVWAMMYGEAYRAIPSRLEPVGSRGSKSRSKDDKHTIHEPAETRNTLRQK